MNLWRWEAAPGRESPGVHKRLGRSWGNGRLGNGDMTGDVEYIWKIMGYHDIMGNAWV